MTEKPKNGSDNLFSDDNLDDAVINADDTGILAGQHEIVEEELLRGEEGELPPEHHRSKK